MQNKLLVTVDEISDNMATLLIRRDDDEIPLGVVPLMYLPKGTESGDILSLSFEKNESETKEAKRKINDILSQLRNR